MSKCSAGSGQGRSQCCRAPSRVRSRSSAAVPASKASLGTRSVGLTRARPAAGTRAKSCQRPPVESAEFEVRPSTSRRTPADSKSELQALVMDALQRHVERHLDGRPPRGDEEVQGALRQACVSRLAELQSGCGQTISPELLESLRKYIAVLTGEPQRPSIHDTHVCARARPSSVASTRRTSFQQQRVQRAVEAKTQAASAALSERVVQFNAFMRAPEAPQELFTAQTVAENHHHAADEDSGLAAEAYELAGALRRGPGLQNSMSTIAPADGDVLVNSNMASHCASLDDNRSVTSMTSTITQESTSARSVCGSSYLASPEAVRPSRSTLAQKAARRGVGSVSAAERDALVAEFAAFRAPFLNSLLAR